MSRIPPPLLLILGWALAGCHPALAGPGDRDIQIRTNQIGFLPGQRKQVVVADPSAGPPRSFDVVDEAGQRAFSAPLVPFGRDQDSGERLWRGDFSALRRPGHYRVRVAGLGPSFPFAIGDEVYLPVLRLASRWFYLQRSGIDKDDPVTGLRHRADYTRPALLRDAAGVHPEQTRDVSGGWWDAGDFGRYVPSAASSVSVLLYAYRFNPPVFADGTLHIPESGNGVPDLLDEVRWELQWLLKMQREDGAVHQKAATREYPDVMADRDPQPVHLFQVTTQATAEFCGVMAEASLAFRPIDGAFAGRLLQAAQRGWSWLAAHPQQMPPGGFQNPDDPNGGNYTVPGNENEQRLWAAAALLHATSDPAYAAASARLWARRDRGRVYSVGWDSGYVFAMFAYLDSDAGEPRLKAEIHQVIAAQTTRILDVIHATGYSVALRGTHGEFGYDWGSCGQLLDFAVYLLLAHGILPDRRLVDGAAAQLDWVLGHNPLSKAFITGAGSNPVLHPDHRPSRYAGAAIPGAVGEGPNAMSIGGDPVLARLFAARIPAAKRYADDDRSWATNEPTIYYNAAFVAVAAYFTR